MAERNPLTVLCTAASYYAGKSPSQTYARVAEVANLRLTDAEAEGDLILALEGLDVFEEEPIPPDSPLLSMPNVVCTPHALARTRESSVCTLAMLQDAIRAILEGRLPETCLNPNVRPRFAQGEVML